MQSRLADFKEIKNALGGTVNDVVLAVVAGALGRWLRDRGVRTEGTELRALVPVSIRAEDEQRRARQPDRRDARAAARVRGRPGRAPARGARGDGRAEGVEAGARRRGDRRPQDFAPPTLLAQASRLNFSTRLFNLIVTNVPGPQFPLYLLGREMQEIVPIAFLPENHALAIAIMSYNGKVDFGLLADYDAMPDLDAFAEHLEESLDELLAAARKARQGERALERQQEGRHARHGEKEDAGPLMRRRLAVPLALAVAGLVAPAAAGGTAQPVRPRVRAAGRGAVLPHGRGRAARAQLRRRSARRGRDPAGRR